MTRRVVLRRQIPDDLHGIMAYLEQTSLDVADRFLASCFAAFDDLARMPGIGSPKRIRARTGLGIRSWAVPGFANHLIYYCVTDDAVVILAVMHGARNAPAILKERLP